MVQDDIPARFIADPSTTLPREMACGSPDGLPVDVRTGAAPAADDPEHRTAP